MSQNMMQKKHLMSSNESLHLSTNITNLPKIKELNVCCLFLLYLQEEKKLKTIVVFLFVIFCKWNYDEAFSFIVH